MGTPRDDDGRVQHDTATVKEHQWLAEVRKEAWNRQPSKGTDSAHTSILYLQLPEAWDYKFLWSKHIVVVRDGNPSKLIQLLFHLIDEEIEIQTKQHAHQMLSRVRIWTVIVPVHSQCSFYQLYIINSSMLHQQLTYITQGSHRFVQCGL